MVIFFKFPSYLVEMYIRLLPFIVKRKIISSYGVTKIYSLKNI